MNGAMSETWGKSGQVRNMRYPPEWGQHRNMRYSCEYGQVRNIGYMWQSQKHWVNVAKSETLGTCGQVRNIRYQCDL